jgi:hypothetical protein
LKSLNDINHQIAIDSIVQPPLRPVSDEELSEIIEQIDSAQILLAQGLLREQEYNSLRTLAMDAYENTADHNSIQYRKYDKSRREHTVWREIPRSGYVTEGGGWSFVDIRQQIVELLELKNVNTPPAKEIFLKPNSEFDALVNIRNILSTAVSSIDIKDDYLFTVNDKTKNVTILHILTPYLSTSLDVNVRLLGAEKELPSTISDISTFLAQYQGRAAIKGVAVGKDNRKETHDRFIIIDKNTVYSIGGSLKDLGKSQTLITQIGDKKVAELFMSQFDEWWNKATPYEE